MGGMDEGGAELISVGARANLAAALHSAPEPKSTPHVKGTRRSASRRMAFWRRRGSERKVAWMY